MDINPADADIFDAPLVSFSVPEENIHFNGLVAKPVMDSHQLIDAGKEMMNALHIWVERCESGKSVIYLIYKIGEPNIEAAMEAVKKTGQAGKWDLKQVLGVRNIKATLDQRLIADHVIKLMNGGM